MRLSEAIRLGAMQYPTPRVRLRMFDYDGDGRPCAACALGTAALAVGIHGGCFDFVTGEWPPVFTERFPIATRRDVAAPPCVMSEGDNVGQIISTLFESYHWTREQIADWVETLEQQQAQPEPPARVPATVEG